MIDRFIGNILLSSYPS